MKSLLYKDFLALWKYCRMYFLMCAGFLVAYIFIEDMVFLRVYPMIFMGMLPTSLIAYDERDKWENLALTMPLSRQKIVSAKYLMGLILQSITFALTALALFLQSLRLGTFDPAGYCADLVWTLILAMAAPSLMMPPVFRVGSEKGRLAYTLTLCLVMSAAIGGVVALSLIEGTLEIGSLYVVLVIAFVVLMYPASWALSVHWYKKREF